MNLSRIAGFMICPSAVWFATVHFSNRTEMFNQIKNKMFTSLLVTSYLLVIGYNLPTT